MTTRDGKFSSRVSPVQGGGTRAAVLSVRSESAGGAVRSPEGGPPRRPGKTWEHGDVGGAASYTQRSSVAAAVSGAPTACPDEGANFTVVTEWYLKWNRTIGRLTCLRRMPLVCQPQTSASRGYAAIYRCQLLNNDN